MAKLYKESILSVLSILGIAAPDHLTMDQAQIEDLTVQIKNALTAAGTAAAGEILATKTALIDGVLVTGSMPNKGSNNVEVTTVAGTTIPAGYYAGTGKAVLSAEEAAKVIAGNIKLGVTLLGVEGTYAGE